MITKTLIKTYLDSGSALPVLGRGVLDGRPLEIEVSNDAVVPVRIISAGETLLNLSEKDARFLADQLMKAARTAREQRTGGRHARLG